MLCVFLFTPTNFDFYLCERKAYCDSENFICSCYDQSCVKKLVRNIELKLVYHAVSSVVDNDDVNKKYVLIDAVLYAKICDQTNEVKD